MKHAMNAANASLESLVLRAIAGDANASTTLHEKCEDFSTARRVVALLALNRDAKNAVVIKDWLQAIAELHPARDLSAH